MSRLSARDAARISRVVTQGERTPLGGGIPNRSRRPSGATIPKQVVYLALAVGARVESGSNLTPGSGYATFCVRTPTGWTRIGGRSGLVYNTSNGPAPPGYAQVGWIDGRWVIDVADCIT